MLDLHRATAYPSHRTFELWTDIIMVVGFIP